MDKMLSKEMRVNMKRIILRLVAMTLFLMLCLPALGLAESTKTEGEPKASTPIVKKLTKIKSGYNKVDLNGDKKKDTIRYTFNRENCALTVQIGSAKYKVDVDNWDQPNDSQFRVYVGDLQKKDRYAEVFVQVMAADWGSMGAIQYCKDWIVLRYDGSKIKRLSASYKNISHLGMERDDPGFYNGVPQFDEKNKWPLITVKGNGEIRFKETHTMPSYYYMDAFYAFDYTAVYTLSGSKLVEKKDTKLYPVRSKLCGKKLNPIKVIKGFTAYATQSTKGKKVAIAKGDKLTIKKASLQGWVYFTTSKGKKGYFKLNSSMELSTGHSIYDILAC